MLPSVIPGGAGLEAVAGIPISDVNPCAGALVVEAVAGTPKDKGFAALVIGGMTDGSGTISLGVIGADEIADVEGLFCCCSKSISSSGLSQLVCPDL